jgi:hypothetical protein
MYISTYLYMYIYIYVYVSIYEYTHVYIYSYTCIYIHVLLAMNFSVWLYTCMYVRSYVLTMGEATVNLFLTIIRRILSKLKKYFSVFPRTSEFLIYSGINLQSSNNIKMYLYENLSVSGFTICKFAVTCIYKKETYVYISISIFLCINMFIFIYKYIFMYI